MFATVSAQILFRRGFEALIPKRVNGMGTANAAWSAMPKRSNRRTVVPHPKGGQVRSSKAARASLITETKPEAVGRAWRSCETSEGGSSPFRTRTDGSQIPTR
jgi:hypothetical protein